MSYRETEHLRVLIANERKDRLALVAPIVTALGHEVIAREIDVADVGAVTARERPDVALVGLGESSDHALGLIEKIVREAACPVIVLIHAPIQNSSRRHPNAACSPTSATPTSKIGRARSTSCYDGSPNTTTSKARSGAAPSIERAKGILMERHSINDAQRLRNAARATRAPPTANSLDIATAVVDGHRLLPKQPHAPS